MYPESVDKFIEKLNKIDNNTYVIEEEVTLENGVYEGYLEHDNVSVTSVNVYSGKKLTGEKINNYILSTPSKTPWKKIIKIFSESYKTLYITYETQGDTVEAEDINNIQDSIVRTQIEVDRYKKANDIEVNNLKERATELEKVKADKTYVDTELNKKYNKNEVYTKSETDNRIQEIVGAAPDALDTLKEIADSLNNDADFAGTMTKELSKKVDKVEGKQLSTNDYTTTEKNKLAGIEERANNYTHPATHNASMITEDSTHRFITDTERSNWNDANSKKHTHSNKSILDIITQTLINAWNNAVEHISDTIKHITSEERNLWNTVSNKVDKITGKGLSTNDFTDSYKTKLDGITASATKVQKSNTNGNIVINGSETVVYTHPSGTNPHGTTKSDVGLGNVSNDSQVKRSEMGVASGVATLDANGVNAQAPKSHTHDDRYYTETEANNKFVTKTELGNAGYGDMLKSVYDTNGNGIVDKAEACTGNSATASKLATARGLTIGSTKKTFDGSADVSWSLSEIGAAASSHTHSYLPLTGGTITGATTLQQGATIHVANASGGTSGYLHIAEFKITGAYVNQPIFISLLQRGQTQISTVEISYANSSATDPSLSSIVKTGPANIYIHKSTTSVWNLYVQKTESYDNVTIIDFKKGSYMGGLTVTWKNTLVTALPSGYSTASVKSITTNISGNATTASTLQTARTINGTSFNGSANITTTNWGTARTITIGNAGKSVNGSANVSWSLSEIGAAASSHSHNAIASRGNVTAITGTTLPAVSGISMVQAYNNGYPIAYGNVISLKGAGSGEILVGWSGTSGAHAPVYVRSKRDTSDANWSGWAQLYTTANKPTPSDIGAMKKGPITWNDLKGV